MAEKKNNQSIVTVDANNKSLGRLASEVAILLMGKNKVTYQAHQITGDKVKVINVDKLKLTGKKKEQKIYYSYSGYPGGIKTKSIADMSYQQILMKAVYNMLPKNKLRKQILKRLIIE